MSRNSPRRVSRKGRLLNWLIDYLVVGVAVAAVASVICDRFRVNAFPAALLFGLIWPVAIVGATQVGLWIAVAKLFRSAPAGGAAPMRARVDTPSR